MNFQERMIWLLSPLVDNEVFWNLQRDNMPVGKSFIILSTSGGKSEWYLEKKLPDSRNSRLQVSIFCDTPDEREVLSLQIEKLLCETPYFEATQQHGNWITGTIPNQKLYSAIGQFGVWHKPVVP